MTTHEPADLAATAERRAETVREIRPVDVLPEESAERMTQALKVAFNAPMALLLMLDGDRQLVRHDIGWPSKSLARKVLPASFGAWDPDRPVEEPIVVNDIAADALLKGIPALRELHATAYAGANIIDRHGTRIGTLCVLDKKVRKWTDRDGALLMYLAAQCAAEVGLRMEIATREQVEGQLLHNTLHDPLTELPNRTLLMERLGHAIQRSRRRADFRFAVLFLDLDRFKLVNDSLGHHAGDQLLVAVANRLKMQLRTTDTVARLGGDEFAILLEDLASFDDAGRVAERMHADLLRPIMIGEHEVYTSASIGIVLGTAGHDLPEFVLRSADMAMYRAKTGGRSRYEMFDRAMHTQAIERLQRETDLRHAVERQELSVHFQPIISLPAGTIVGAEALVRWTHPTRGRVSPAEFIPLAEEMGLILPIGKYVLIEACRQMREWQDMVGGVAELTIGVNLSAKQFNQPNLLDQVGSALQQTRLPPHLLKLEITETAIIDNPEAATRVLGELKQLGVQIHMDDFGTGYSSLSYLHRLPIDALKIDRSFIGQIDTDPRTLQLVMTILELAANLGVRSIAEGVEKPQQLEQLRKLACDFGQGYLFSPPLPADKFGELLKSKPKW